MDNCKPVWREAGQMQSQALDTETNFTKDNQAMRLTQDSLQLLHVSTSTPLTLT